MVNDIHVSVKMLGFKNSEFASLALNKYDFLSPKLIKFPLKTYLSNNI